MNTLKVTRSFFRIVFRLVKWALHQSPPKASPIGLPKAKVLYVLDGDTVDVIESGKKIRIRLSAIDCPEDGQPWGDTAKYGLIKLIGGRWVYLEVYGFDPHGRTLATIYVINNSKLVNINEKMIVRGHAWVMRQYYGHLPKYRQARLDRLERWARFKQVGLWATENPTPPWRWRKRGNNDES